MRRLSSEEARKRKEALYADLEAGKLGIGEACRRMRHSIGLNREEYAKAAKISPETLKNIEQGRGNPTLEVLQKIAAPFGLELRFAPRSSPVDRIRRIAIGDIHGQRKALEKLLGKISPASPDQLVFLGDYIDRGPDSRGVIDLLLEIEDQLPGTIFLRGNHEQMFLDALAERETIHVPGYQRLRNISRAFSRDAQLSDGAIFYNNGGAKTLDSYGTTLDGPFPPEHINFLLNTKLFHRSGRFLFVHAGALPSQPPESLEDPYTLLWSRSAPPGTNGEIHIVGHHASMDGKPFFEPGRYSLDTGAAYGRTLTACEVQTKAIWQVQT